MTVVVGFGPDVNGIGGLRLAGQLARTDGSPLVLCCVVHDAFEAAGLRDAHNVDREWRSHLEKSAAEALATAREALPSDLETIEVVRTGRSVPGVLREEGARRDASLLVVGSASVGGLGRIALGSTTDRLVHSSTVPVALAPRGYRDEGAVRRLVLAVEPTGDDVALAARTAALAERFGAEVQVVTFLARQRSAVSALADQGVFRAWRDQVSQTHQSIKSRLEELGVTVTSTRLVEGERWSAALLKPDWEPGDLLVVGSSRHGPAASVFLGSNASRILRRSPVPVVVLPRG